MSTVPLVQHDERTVAVENSGYKWAYTLLSFALLMDVAYRGVVRQEAAWDLMAFVIVGGAVCLFYQVRRKTLAQGWAKTGILFACVGGVIGALLVLVIKLWFRG